MTNNIRYFRNINDFLRSLDPWSQSSVDPIDEVSDSVVGSIPQGRISDRKNTDNITYHVKEDGGVAFTMNVAGVSKENVIVELSGNTVDITASEDGYLHSYSFNVNATKYNLNPSSITVQCKNGLLVVSFQKKEEPTKQSNRLTIQ